MGTLSLILFLAQVVYVCPSPLCGFEKPGNEVTFTWNYGDDSQINGFHLFQSETEIGPWQSTNLIVGPEDRLVSFKIKFSSRSRLYFTVKAFNQIYQSAIAVPPVLIINTAGSPSPMPFPDLEKYP